MVDWDATVENDADPIAASPLRSQSPVKPSTSLLLDVDTRSDAASDDSESILPSSVNIAPTVRKCVLKYLYSTITILN